MSREVKFRIWDVQNNQFFGAKGYPMTFGLNYLPHFLIRENFIYQQFTGLKDKDDKDICEGDILNFYCNGELKSKGLVKWDDKFASFDFGVPSYNYEKEIVGNIFDNPELIK